MTHESKHFTRIAVESGETSRSPETRYLPLLNSGAAILHEGATFNRYTDDWGDPLRFALPEVRVSTSERWKALIGHYKIALRAIVGSSPEKSIAALLPPGCLVSNSALIEGTPERRLTQNSLRLIALLNATTFSWLLSFYADLNVNLFALKYLPVPKADLPGFLAHGALRLSCNHAGYRPLWQEQVGDAWREGSNKDSWPVLSDDDARWAVRAQLDAVVAQAYGLDRAQYEHVLASFSHSSYKRAPELCLAAFDELVALGLDAFTKKHDPYWDIPLVTTLPKPVLNLTGSAPTQTEPAKFVLTAPEPKAKAKRGKR
ncbi:MAG: hypothetical protein QM784_40465 [Polyangiaceae bacterium]